MRLPQDQRLVDEDRPLHDHRLQAQPGQVAADVGPLHQVSRHQQRGPDREGGRQRHQVLADPVPIGVGELGLHDGPPRDRGLRPRERRRDEVFEHRLADAVPLVERAAGPGHAPGRVEEVADLLLPSPRDAIDLERLVVLGPGLAGDVADERGVLARRDPHLGRGDGPEAPSRLHRVEEVVAELEAEPVFDSQVLQL